MCLRLAKSKVQLRVSEWAIPEKFFYFTPEKVFYFTPEKFHILNPNPLLPVFAFSIIVFVLLFLTATILLIPAPLLIQSHKNTLIAIENTYLNGLFFKPKISTFPLKKFQS